MSRVRKYVQRLKELYGDGVIFKESSYDKEILDSIPLVLREFYREYESIQLPFGEIDSIDIAIRHSNTAEPFKSEGWFCFGFDGYFSFWLCKYVPDKENLSFTSWDHDSGDDIGEAVYESLIDFLEDLRLEYEEIKNELD